MNAIQFGDRIIPEFWAVTETAGMFIHFVNYIYSKYNTLPDYLPHESPNFKNYLFPKHKENFSNKIHISGSWDENLTMFFGEILEFIITHTEHHWHYAHCYTNDTSIHTFYFTDKNDALRFKLRFG